MEQILETGQVHWLFIPCMYVFGVMSGIILITLLKAAKSDSNSYSEELNEYFKNDGL